MNLFSVNSFNKISANKFFPKLKTNKVESNNFKK